MLVGDLIVGLRTLGPDPCGVMPTPSLANFPVAQLAQACTLTPGQYFCKVTLFTSWGETDPSAESAAITVDNAHGIQVTGVLPVGVSKLRVYFGIGVGNELQFQDFTALPGNIVAFGSAGIPPVRNRAYLPDTDGGFAAAQAVYDWLNEALLIMGKASGGVYDATGVPTVNQQPMYQLRGNWLSIDHAWYDGWVMDIGNKRDILYRDRVSAAVAGLTVLTKSADVQLIEIFPQANRTAVTTLTTNQMTATDVSVGLTGGFGGFLLPFGLALLGGSEIVAYQSSTSNLLSGLLRGLGGTVPFAWPIGTSVQELNVRMAGYRLPSTYTVGQSNSVVPVDPAWRIWLAQFMLAKFREAEGERQVASGLRKEFMAEVEKLGKNKKAIVGPRQVGGDTNVGEVYGGSLGGGWLLP